MADPLPLFTRDELKQFRYKCSHKLAISLTVGAVYLFCLTAFFLNKVFHGAAPKDKFLYYGLAAGGYVLVVGLVAMIVRRSQSLNFSRFLNGCVKFDKLEYKLEYVELRMPGPFSPRCLKYPVHLMILGKVLEQSTKPENAEVGRRMVAASADRDPALEPFREADLAELMKYHETFLAAHPEMVQEWRNAESFHALMVHLILPVVIIVVIVSFILKGCEPPEETEERSLPAAAGEGTEAVSDAGVEAEAGIPAGDVRNAADSAAEKAVGAEGESAGSEAEITPQPETLPPQG